MYITSIPGFTLRPATRSDIPQILGFIRELAEYEKLSDAVTASESVLENSMFDKQRAFALMAELDGEAVGYALYFFNFSTFLGRAGLYLEDIYVRPRLRGNGYGTEIFKVLARVAREQDCGRMEWSCLDWNEPSRAFYKNMGAVIMDAWMLHRLDENGINRLSE